MKYLLQKTALLFLISFFAQVISAQYYYEFSDHWNEDGTPLVEGFYLDSITFEDTELFTRNFLYDEDCILTNQNYYYTSFHWGTLLDSINYEFLNGKLVYRGHPDNYTTWAYESDGLEINTNYFYPTWTGSHSIRSRVKYNTVDSITHNYHNSAAYGGLGFVLEKIDEEFVYDALNRLLKHIYFRKDGDRDIDDTLETLTTYSYFENKLSEVIVNGSRRYENYDSHPDVIDYHADTFYRKKTFSYSDSLLVEVVYENEDGFYKKIETEKNGNLITRLIYRYYNDEWDLREKEERYFNNEGDTINSVDSEFKNNEWVEKYRELISRDSYGQIVSYLEFEGIGNRWTIFEATYRDTFLLEKTYFSVEDLLVTPSERIRIEYNDSDKKTRELHQRYSNNTFNTYRDYTWEYNEDGVLLGYYKNSFKLQTYYYSDCLESGISSIEDKSVNQSWRVFPNPTHSTYSVRSVDDNELSLDQIKVYSAMGELVETIDLEKTQQQEFGLQLRTGSYVVQGLKNGERLFSQYVIKI